MSRSFLVAIFIFLLVSPYLILISFTPRAGFVWPAHAFGVMGFTLAQAFLSAVAALIVGSFAAAGLLSVQKTRPLFEVAALALNTIPVLFVIIGVLNIFPALSGLGGIVFLHVVLNTGLVAVSLARSWSEKIGGLSELAWIEGAGRVHFFKKSVWGLLRADMMLTGLFVFVVCWTSFAVPLLIGGSRATTLEVLIFENIQSFATWPQALALSLAQAVFIFGLSWPLKRGDIQTATRVARMPHLEWRPGLLIVAAPLLALFASLTEGLTRGWDSLEIQIFTGELTKPFMASTAVALMTGSLVLFLLLILSAVFPEKKLRRFFIGTISPGAVLSGFALLVIWRATGAATFFKISIGLALLSIPAFYRLRWDQLLGGLSGQVTVARTMGAKPALIFYDIILPQVWPQACRLAGLAAVWAWGDFALSSVVSERAVTLALMARGLIGSYRVENAVALVWVILIGAALTYLFFEGLSHVGRSRS